MEFHEKLQELRKQKGLTQEKLAESLYVSRTAVSKWESGRGYPNIDSLKAIAGFFEITIDELLSGEELLTVAEDNSRQREMHRSNLVFGMLDLSTAMLFFLPFFGEKANGAIREVNLLLLTSVAQWLRSVYAAVVIGMILWGILTLALQTCHQTWWERSRKLVSLFLNGAGVLLFIVSLQPYAAVLLFVFLAVKAAVLVKWR